MDLTPLAFFLVVGAVPSIYFYFRHRTRQEIQQTLRIAVEQGRELTPELVEAIGSDVAGSGERDLRKGVLWLALAVGMAIMAWVIDETDLLAVASFPLMFGIAYLGLWLRDPGKST